MSGLGIRARCALYGEPFLQAARTLIISHWHHHGTPRCRLGPVQCYRFILTGLPSTGLNSIGMVKDRHPLTLREPFTFLVKLLCFFWCEEEALRTDLELGTSERDCLRRTRRQDALNQAPFHGLRDSICTKVQHLRIYLGQGTDGHTSTGTSDSYA
jgi:hypothetical protein